MISRYSLYTTSDLRDHFSLAAGLPKGIKPHYNVHPTLSMPVIVKRDDHVIAEQMTWGLVPKGTKNVNSVFRYKTYNVPSEKILAKHSWEMAVRQYRCLIPANGFYILSQEGSEKRAYYIRLKESPLFAFAGIYSTWKDEDGTAYSTYSLITIESSHSLRHLTDRMPVILNDGEEAKWLDTSITDANGLFDMLRPTSIERLDITEVGVDVHSMKIDTPQLIALR